MLHTLLLLAALTQPADAATFEGVSMSDTATVGGQAVVLNGMGLREKMFINVYVGGLYLPTKTTDANTAINSDVVKRLVMHFVYDVPAESLVEAYEEARVKLPGGNAQKDNFIQLYNWLGACDKGDKIVFDYVPGTGTSVNYKGSQKGTIPGVDFMKALWGVYLGANPPTSDFKEGLLGG